MAIESFQVVPLQKIIPAYLYAEYQDDPDLPSLFDALNAYGLGYLQWFLQTPLGVYTLLSGSLLNWIGLALYGMPRPVLSTGTIEKYGGYDTKAYDTEAYGAHSEIGTGTVQVATDDIYKRCLTWNLYRGDGQVFSLQWLKNRVARFMNGPSGSDCAVLDFQPSITVSGSVFTVTQPASETYTALAQAYNVGALAFPFSYSLVFST